MHMNMSFSPHDCHCEVIFTGLAIIPLDKNSIFVQTQGLKDGWFGGIKFSVFLPLVEHLSFVKFSHILSSWLHAQSNCLSTLQAQNPRLPDWDWDSLRQRFFSNLTDTLEMRKPHSASQHCCWTDQRLQAGGVSLIRFLQKAVSLKSLSFSLSWRLYSACSRAKS